MSISVLEEAAVKASDFSYDATVNGDVSYLTFKAGSGSDEMEYECIYRFNDLTDSRVTNSDKRDTQFGIYKAADNSGIIISFRGTASLRDGYEDLNSGWESWNRNRALMLDEMVAEIIAIRSINPDAAITLTGHSLGGALAQYAAYDLQIRLNDLGFTNDVNLYTVATPGVEQNLIVQVGQRDGVYLDGIVGQLEDIKHFYKEDDVVPKLIGDAFGGEAAWYKVESGVAELLLQAHSIEDYARLLIAGASVTQDPVETFNLDEISGLVIYAYSSEWIANKSQPYEGRDPSLGSFVWVAEKMVLLVEHVKTTGIIINGLVQIITDDTSKAAFIELLEFQSAILDEWYIENGVDLDANGLEIFEAIQALIGVMIYDLEIPSLSIFDAVRSAAYNFVDIFSVAAFIIPDGMSDIADELSSMMQDLSDAKEYGGSGQGVSLTGDEFNNNLSGTDYDDQLSGEAGDDDLTAFDGEDVLFGGMGNDRLDGGFGNDILHGDEGDDQLYTGAGASNLAYGGDGNDYIMGGRGTGFFSHNSGDEAFLYGQGGDDILGVGNTWNNNTAIKYIYYIDGGTGNDTLYGGGGNNTLVGGDGNDIVVSENVTDGGDLIVDGAGVDYYDVNSGEALIVAAIDLVSDSFYGNMNTTLSFEASFMGVTLTPTPTVAGGSNLFSLDIGAGWVEGIGHLIGGSGNDSFVFSGISVYSLFEGGSGDDYFESINAAGTPSFATFKGDSGSDTFATYAVNGPCDIVDYNAEEGDVLLLKGLEAYNGGADPTIGQLYSAVSGDDLIIKFAQTPVSTAYTVVVLKDFNISGGNKKLIVDFSEDGLEQIGLRISAGGTIYAEATTGTNNSNNITGTSGNDTLSTLGGDDTISAGAGIDIIFAGVGNDLAYGGDGNDSLTGGTGNDTMSGNAGADTFVIGNGDGDDTIVDYSASAGDLIAFAMQGMALGNLLTNRAGNDLLLNMGASILTLQGFFSGFSGTKNVLISFDGAAATTVTIDSAGGINQAIGATESANILTGTASAETISGLGGNDTISGLAGDDLLLGGTGNDTLIGGVGNDIYDVDSASDVVTENASEGRDTVRSTVTLTLAANVENLTLIGGSAINGTGNTLDNILIGNSGVNTLTGGAGNDTLDGAVGVDILIGGTGNDIYIVNTSTDTITENASEGTDTIQSTVTYTIASLVNVENLTLTGGASVSGTGNSLDNILTGNAANNTLTGGAGNDTLIGGAGIDALIGGAGNDVYEVDSTADAIIESASEGTDLVRSAVTFPWHL